MTGARALQHLISKMGNAETAAAASRPLLPPAAEGALSSKQGGLLPAGVSILSKATAPTATAVF